MQAALRVNTFDLDKVARHREQLDEFDRIHAVLTGSRQRRHERARSTAS